MCPNLTPIEMDGYNQPFVELEISLEADVVLPYTFLSGHCYCGPGDLCVDFCVAGTIFAQGCFGVLA